MTGLPFPDVSVAIFLSPLWRSARWMNCQGLKRERNRVSLPRSIRLEHYVVRTCLKSFIIFEVSVERTSFPSPTYSDIWSF